ncbi:XrtA/PEP-CTERM system histidine kinase PrsK [Acidihalobacter ferrooxydans]|uniref:histidine kinase n=1 Tax=Acidihalobacter ferrooxydans TaxID=1765967 RepID=A0A1P8UGI5_9GAMM|nr:XrtA/PEP-CTERM system histidine kinase PrsK [Acidihalobacter ferrooxydans]APZ42978.1 hypothetical protein BW247_07620 [Acidihalobacter ferrooxydans]
MSTLNPIAWAALISYAVGAFAFTLLTALLLVNRRKGPLGTAFTTACFINALWLGFLASWPLLTTLPWLAVVGGEALRDGAWLYLLARLLRSEAPESRKTNFGLQALALTLPLAWFIWAFWPSPAPPPSRLSFLLGGLVVSVAALFLLEQFWRNLAPERRWALKFIAIGIAAPFAYDVLLYSQALLYHHISPDFWAARGAVAALSAPLLAVAAARNPDWSGNLFVSRRLVFRTTVLLAAGIYLLLIAAGGYYIRYFGGSWGEFWQIVFLFAAAVGLVVLLSSAQIRARIRVLLLKNFHAYHYDYRNEWTRLIHQLYRPDDERSPYERAARALADILDTPGAALFARRDGASGDYVPIIVSAIDLPHALREPDKSPMTEFLQREQWIIDADTLADDRRSHPDLSLPDWLERITRWWLVVPLTFENELIGFIVLNRPRAPHRLDWEDRDLIKVVALQLAAFLAQHQATQALSEARQFQAFTQMSAFLMHDLKNLIAQQQLLVKNAARHKRNPAFVDDMVATIDESVQRMTHLLEQLRSGELRPRRPVRVLDSVQSEVTRTADRKPQARIEYPPEVAEARIAADPQALSMVLHHLIRNAQDATDQTGDICVRLQLSGDWLLIDVIDTGCGMSETFMHEHLFTPFESTKAARGMGIGAFQVKTFAHQHGGDVEVESQPGKGTRFRLRLALAAASAQTDASLEDKQ